MLLRVAVVTLVFVLGLGIFRSQGMDAVLQTLARMLGLVGGGTTWFEPWVLVSFAAVLLCNAAAEWDLPARITKRLSMPVQCLGYALLIAVLVLFAPDGSEAFVYFQF